MFIQSSELTANPGKSGVLGPMVPQMRDILTRETGTEWWAWAVLTGRPYGTHLLSTRFDDYATMVAAVTGLGGSSEWAEFTSGADGVLAHPAQTSLGEVIAVTGEPTPPKPFVTVTRATMTGAGMSGDALGWAVKVMEHVTKITGNGGTVATSASGGMFQVFWISGVDTAEELDTGHQAVNGDTGYLEMIAEAGSSGLFVDGASERMIIVQVP